MVIYICEGPLEKVADSAPPVLDIGSLRLHQQADAVVMAQSHVLLRHMEGEVL